MPDTKDNDPALIQARLAHLARLVGGSGIDPNGKTVLAAGNGANAEFWRKRGAITQRFGASGDAIDIPQADIVDALGALSEPQSLATALAALADRCNQIMFVEAAVAEDDHPNLPTRASIFAELSKRFPHVYQPSYQPDHEDFPTDWRTPPPASRRVRRTTFVASRTPLNAGALFPRVLDNQTRHAKREANVQPGLDGLLARAGFGFVFDVGANQGQFAAKLRKLGYSGPIASFEPLSSAFVRLKAFADRDPNLTAFPFALGAEAGRQDIFISGNSASSSFRPIEEATVGAEPMTAVVGRESVEIRRLDDIAADVLAAANAGPILLKLDTQGTEREVMQGSAATLEKIHYILCECSLVSVYKGEPVIEEQIRWMREKGFDPISLEPGWSDPATGETYQIDALFKRRR